MNKSELKTGMVVEYEGDVYKLYTTVEELEREHPENKFGGKAADFWDYYVGDVKKVIFVDGIYKVLD